MLGQVRSSQISHLLNHGSIDDQIDRALSGLQAADWKQEIFSTNGMLCLIFLSAELVSTLLFLNTFVWLISLTDHLFYCFLLVYSRIYYTDL